MPSWFDLLLQQRRVNRAVHRRLTILEYRMALTDQALADLDAATNEVAAELDELRDLVAGNDAALADRIGAAATRLRGLAVDPDNPVPDGPDADV